MSATLAAPIEATLADLPDPVVAALAISAPGSRMITVATGIPFSALVWGDPSARPLVLLHGVTASAAIWWRVGPALAAAEGRYVVAPDLPGHGRTGHWTGHHRFDEMAVDMAAWIRAAGLDRADLQVIGHSYGAMTAAWLPAAGLQPASLVLLDPPVVPLSTMSLMASDPAERTYDDLDEAIAAVSEAEPTWTPGDIRAKAEALTELDEAAARAILLENGDWDGGLVGLADRAALTVDTWLIKGVEAHGCYVPDLAIPAFVARLGADHILTVKDGPHSPMRMLVEATLVALLRALG